MAGTALARPPTALQKATAQAIVNIFETGSIQGRYAQVTLMPGDAGHLTYGRSQTTLASGNLFLLIKAYCAASGAAYGGQLRRYLPPLQACDCGLDNDAALRNLLRSAGADPVMQSEQDSFFDRVYWTPALTYAGNCGIGTPLGITVVYDSVVHGSFRRICDMTDEEAGRIGTISEQVWVSAYVSTRRQWLAGHSNPLLHRTVYRMDAFRDLMTQDKWDLALPVSVLGRRIEAALLGPAPVRVSAQDERERLLRLTSPAMKGEDVAAVQQALRKLGVSDVPQNGVYDRKTAEAVIRFQRSRALSPDGMVGPASRAALGL